MQGINHKKAIKKHKQKPQVIIIAGYKLLKTEILKNNSIEDKKNNIRDN
jgi:hypothetical protein